MTDPQLPFHNRAAIATFSNQRELARVLGISLRSVSRWVAGQGGGPSLPHHYEALARAAYPRDRDFAAECAGMAGTTLIAMGLERPPPPPPAPQLPPPKPVVTPAQADAVVCAAADVRDVPPREVRAMVAAAFARAHELGFTTEAVAVALAKHLPVAAPTKARSV